MPSLIARLGLVAASTALALVGVELGARVVAPRQLDALDMQAFTGPASSPDQMSALIPGSANPHFAGGAVRVNQEGLRGPELTEPPRGDRILAVGDSITFGYGVPEDATWHAVLAARLTEAGTPTESVNAGLSGAGLRYAAGFLERRCAALAPDRVFVSVTLNDIGPYPDKAAGATAPPPRSPHRWLLRHSHVYAGVMPVLKGVAYTQGVLDLNHNPGFGFIALTGPSAEQETAWTQSLAQLDRARAAAAACGAPLTIVVFPVETQISDAAAQLYHDRFGLDLGAEPGSGEPQARLAEWARARDQPLIDLLETFRAGAGADLYLRNERVALDPVHPSIEGHRQAALAIEAALSEPPPTL